MGTVSLDNINNYGNLNLKCPTDNRYVDGLVGGTSTSTITNSNNYGIITIKDL